MITWIIIALTALVSWMAFNNDSLMQKLQFNAAKIVQGKEYYRLVSHALVHATWSHLFVNMLVLYFFGRGVESYLDYFFGNKSTAIFLMLYIGGILASNLWSLIKHRNNYYYNAIGASGAVSAVLFAFIFLNPWEKLYFFGLIPIPGILFAAGYLLYSWQMARKDSDQIAHDSHFLGALFGFFFLALLKPSLLTHFLDQLFMLI
jgi:membrane associated rhomboid family serine protease